MNSKLIALLVVVSIICLGSCKIPYSTCSTCSYYQLPENVNQLAYYYIKVFKKTSNYEYAGKQRIYLLRNKKYILHFKQCPNVKLYDIKVFVYEKQDNKTLKPISEFTCINSREAYSIFTIEKTGEYFIEVKSMQKLYVHLILGQIK